MNPAKTPFERLSTLVRGLSLDLDPAPTLVVEVRARYSHIEVTVDGCQMPGIPRQVSDTQEPGGQYRSLDQLADALIESLAVSAMYAAVKP